MPQGTKWELIRQQIAPPSKRFIKDHHKLFFQYIRERERIWKKRRANKKPPWTDDPILRDHHFTNVFRIRDRGTQWLLQEINTFEPKEVIWRVVQYRWPNYHTLYEEYDWIPHNFNRAKWLKRIERVKQKHGKWHTSAHIVLQSNFKQSRAENFLDYLALLDADFDAFCKGILEAKDMESAFKHVLKYKGFGGFTAYEILIDLCYLEILPDNFRDQFANPGPGCTEGIRLIYPQAKSRQQLMDAMKKLRDNQDKMLRGKVPRLTLQDIEFCLCEFSKYVKIKHGTGRGRKYRVNSRI